MASAEAATGLTLHRAVRCSMFAEEFNSYTDRRKDSLDTAQTASRIKQAIFDLLGEVRGASSSRAMPSSAVDVHYTTSLAAAPRTSTAATLSQTDYDILPNGKQEDYGGASVWDKHYIGVGAGKIFAEEVTFSSGQEDADWEALFDRLYELRSTSTRRYDHFSQKYNSSQPTQQRYVCMKMDAAHIGVPYGLHADPREPGHYTIYPVHPVVLSDFNPNETGYGRGQLNPNIGDVYRWVPCGLVLKAQGESDWRKYRPESLGEVDYQIRTVIWSLSYVADTIATVEEIDLIDSLIKSVAQTCTAVQDLAQMSEGTQYYIAWALNEYLSDSTIEEFDYVKEVRDSVRKLSFEKQVYDYSKRNLPPS